MNPTQRLAHYLSDYLEKSSYSRDEFVSLLAIALNSEPELAEALLEGILPPSEIEPDLLTPIARLTQADFSTMTRSLGLSIGLNLTEDNPLLNARYRLLDLIGVGSIGRVYKVFDRLHSQPLALKQLTNASQNGLRFNHSYLDLAHEFRLLASLWHPNIISVIEFGFDDQRKPYFTMELLENAQTILEAGKNVTLEAQVQLLFQTLQALSYLHQRNFLHRDLKPNNILVVDGQVKVLDFGLSVDRQQVRGMAGTLAWIAPELLMGSRPDRSADLYAVGMIAYQLLTGHYPFADDDPTLLLDAILGVDPDLGGISIPLQPVLKRLLAKDPANRFASAMEVIAALRIATGQHPPAEPLTVRESFLQAAPLVGREPELEQMTTALHQTVQGEGSPWLVGGESGVGKSRLLNEIAMLAMVEGALVLRGQAVNEGGSPYQPWHSILRQLLIVVPPKDEEASVLKSIVPGIEPLLERTIPDPLEFEPRAGHIRLLGAITAVFLRLQQPCVVLLEDLQWTGDESLAVLSQLNQLTHRLPLLVVASYRDDERRYLPAILPEMLLLKLNCLNDEDIAKLCESMLGVRPPAIIDFLQRETEGNVLFYRGSAAFAGGRSRWAGSNYETDAAGQWFGDGCAAACPASYQSHST